MAMRKAGDRAALLVVDMQVGVMADVQEPERLTQMVALAVDRARAQGAPVLWVQHEDQEMPKDSPGWQMVPALAPAPGEVCLVKAYNSSFEGTPLEEELDRLGVSRVVLAGAATNWCIRATAYAALERGYDLTLVADGHGTGPLERADGSVIAARDIIDDLNVAMTWLSYPGRRNGVARVAELDFGGGAGEG